VSCSIRLTPILVQLRTILVLVCFVQSKVLVLILVQLLVESTPLLVAMASLVHFAYLTNVFSIDKSTYYS
jgi:hypothetical protein